MAIRVVQLQARPHGHLRARHVPLHGSMLGSLAQVRRTFQAACIRPLAPKADRGNAICVAQPQAGFPSEFSGDCE